MDESHRFEFLLALGGLLVGIGVAFLQIFQDVPLFSWILIALGCAIFAWQGIRVFGWQEHVSRYQRTIGLISVAALAATGGYLLGRWQYQCDNSTRPVVTVTAYVSPSASPWATVSPTKTRRPTRPTPRSTGTPQTSPTRTLGPKAQLSLRARGLATDLQRLLNDYGAGFSTDAALFREFSERYHRELRPKILAVLLEIEHERPYERDFLAIQTKAATPKAFTDVITLREWIYEVSEKIHD